MTRLAAVKQERDKADRDKWAYALALGCIVRGEQPDCVERFKEHNGDGRYTVSAYRLAGAHGGLVVTRFKAGTPQADSVQAFYFDDWAAQFDGRMGDPYYTPYLIAISNIRAQRNRCA